MELHFPAQYAHARREAEPMTNPEDDAAKARQKTFEKVDKLLQELKEKYGQLPPLSPEQEDKLHTEIHNWNRSRGTPKPERED